MHITYNNNKNKNILCQCQWVSIFQNSFLFTFSATRIQCIFIIIYWFRFERSTGWLFNMYTVKTESLDIYLRNLLLFLYFVIIFLVVVWVWAYKNFRLTLWAKDFEFDRRELIWNRIGTELNMKRIAEYCNVSFQSKKTLWDYCNDDIIFHRLYGPLYLQLPFTIQMFKQKNPKYVIDSRKSIHFVMEKWFGCHAL